MDAEQRGVSMDGSRKKNRIKREVIDWYFFEPPFNMGISHGVDRDAGVVMEEQRGILVLKPGVYRQAPIKPTGNILNIKSE